MDSAALFLIIDDDPDLLAAMARVLSKDGYRVICASTGEEGVRLAKEQQPDMVVVDMMLPDINGIEVCRQIQAATEPNTLDIILISSIRTSTEDKVEGFIAGVCEYITRPLSNAEFLARLNTRLKEKQTRESLRLARNKAQDSSDWEKARRIDLEEELQSVFSHAPICMFITDGDARLLKANPALSELVGGDLQSISGSPCGAVFSCLHSEAHPTGCGFSSHCTTCHIRNSITDTFSAGTTHNQVETQLNCRQEGQIVERVVRFSTSPVMVSGEKLVFVCLEDITQRKSAEKESRELSEQLFQAQKMDSVGRLAGGVAHDFNNMLSVILGYAQMAFEEASPGSSLREDMKQILDASKRSTDIIRQLMAFARKEAISPQTIEFNAVITSMNKMLERLIGENITLNWRPGIDLCSIKIDPSQVDQLLVNLCVNARDAIDGIGTITIETSSITIDTDYCRRHQEALPGKYTMLAVSDNGCGMKPEVREKIFDPFFTTKELGQGTGLGLATVYGIVKQNSGFIQVNSELGLGTTFKIYLPLHQDEIAELQRDDSETFNLHGDESILIVEDDKAILKVTSRVLESLGYRVLIANTPGEAIRVVESNAGGLDLLLTDVIMPEMNGKDLSEKVLSICPNLKCMFMSGYTANVFSQQGLLDGSTHFIQKPFSKNELAKKVRQVLNFGE